MANIQKLEERERQKKAADDDGKNMLKMRSLLTENKLPLEDMKRRVLKNLEILEVSHTDLYLVSTENLGKIKFLDREEK